MPYSDREKRRQYAREWLAKRRAAYFADKRCARCGSTENLELDHIDPTGKVSHKIWSWSTERRAAELAKCQVLCRGCHQEKSWAEAGVVPYRHGTNTTYRKRGCKCEECRADNARRCREYRQGR